MFPKLFVKACDLVASMREPSMCGTGRFDLVTWKDEVEMERAQARSKPLTLFLNRGTLLQPVGNRVLQPAASPSLELQTQ
ncbi:hypothetical protein AKJ16_DCAP22014 [Drosera capensis]